MNITTRECLEAGVESAEIIDAIGRHAEQWDPFEEAKAQVEE